MVAHERLPEQPVTMKGLFAKSRSFSNLAAFLDLNGIIILLVALEVRRSENFSLFISTPFFYQNFNRCKLSIGPGAIAVQF